MQSNENQTPSKGYPSILKTPTESINHLRIVLDYLEIMEKNNFLLIKENQELKAQIQEPTAPQTPNFKFFVN